jgi:hypothetical protein
MSFLKIISKGSFATDIAISLARQEQPEKLFLKSDLNLLLR